MRVWLRNARIAAGYTQEKLGELIGKDITTIGKYENGTRTPRWPIARQLGEILKIDANRFYEEEGENVS